MSYELTLSATFLFICLNQEGLNYNILLSSSEIGWSGPEIIIVLPLFLVSALAETARAPFDLPEAESEIVAGFITELSAVPFVLYFLAEYSSLVLLSVLGATLFNSGFSLPLLTGGIIFLAV